MKEYIKWKNGHIIKIDNIQDEKQVEELYKKEDILADYKSEYEYKYNETHDYDENNQYFEFDENEKSSQNSENIEKYLNDEEKNESTSHEEYGIEKN